MHQLPDGEVLYEPNDRLWLALTVISGMRTIESLSNKERFVLAGRTSFNERCPNTLPFPDTKEKVRELIANILYDRLQYPEENQNY